MCPCWCGGEGQVIGSISRSKIAEDEEWLRTESAKEIKRKAERAYTDVGLLGIEFGERDPSLAADPALRPAFGMPVRRCGEARVDTLGSRSRSFVGLSRTELFGDVSREEWSWIDIGCYN